MRFHICLVQPPGYVHSEALTELAELLYHGLADLGHQPSFARQSMAPDARNILLGCHLASPGLVAQLPPGTIAINSEQIADPAVPVRGQVFEWAKAATLWDYSPANLAVLAAAGLPARLLPIGWHPALRRIPVAPEQDIDVLFYGSINERRRVLLEAVRDAGMRVAHGFGVYGAARDAMVARAKLVLNLHFFESQILEIVRVSYLMNNAKAVVAEINPDSIADPEFTPGLCGVPRDGIVAACRRLVDDQAARRDLEARALATLQRRPQAALLAPLLAG